MIVQASHLNGIHLGSYVSFQWKWPTSGVVSLIYGELREIHHTARGDTIINVTGEDSEGDKTEFVIDFSTQVWVKE